MQRRTAVGFSTFVLLALGACAPPAPPAAAVATPPDTAAIRAELDQLWAAYGAADTAGDVATLAGFYTENARIDFMGGPPIVGLEAITSTLQAIFATNKYSGLGVVPERTTARESTTAYQVGRWWESYTVKGKRQQTDYGRYAAAYTKGADGRWRAAYFMGFTDSTRVAKP